MEEELEIGFDLKSLENGKTYCEINGSKYITAYFTTKASSKLEKIYKIKIQQNHK